MSDANHNEAVVEAALHALVAQRCQRAHAHHFRNGLQGIYASVDVLLRIIDGKPGMALPADKVKDIARKSLRSHEQGINDAVTHLVLQNDASGSVDTVVVMRELLSFIGSDAASHDVQFEDQLTGSVFVAARPSILRLLLLGVLVRCIDSMPGGGRLSVCAVSLNSRSAIEYSLQANDATPKDEQYWNAHAGDERLAWAFNAMQILAHREGGAIETQLAGGPVAKSHRVVRVIFQAANPASPVDR